MGSALQDSYFFYKSHPFQLLSDFGIKLDVGEYFYEGADLIVRMALKRDDKSWMCAHLWKDGISLQDILRFFSLAVLQRFLRPNKIGLQNGCCGARWSCANINREGCKPIPKKGEDFIRCEHYEKKSIYPINSSKNEDL